jgi:hypothetical protein
LARIEDRRHAFIQVSETPPAVVAPPPVEVAPVKEPLANEELVITETVPQAAQTLKPRKPRKA